jgi:hypothetical protein
MTNLRRFPLTDSGPPHLCIPKPELLLFRPPSAPAQKHCVRPPGNPLTSPIGFRQPGQSISDGFPMASFAPLSGTQPGRSSTTAVPGLRCHARLYKCRHRLRRLADDLQVERHPQKSTPMTRPLSSVGCLRWTLSVHHDRDASGTGRGGLR